MAVKPIPEGYHSVTPYFVVQGVPRLLDFLKQAFDATEIFRMPRPDGTIMHAELRIGDSIVMLGEAMEEFPPRSSSIYLYVNDADATYQRALQAGATSTIASGPVLGRPQRRRGGSCWQPLVDRHAPGGCAARGAGEACRCLHAAAALRLKLLRSVAALFWFSACGTAA